MFEYTPHVILPVFPTWVLIIIVAVAVLTAGMLTLIVISAVKYNSKFQRKQVIKGYRMAGASMRLRLKTSEVTGVLYSREIR